MESRLIAHCRQCEHVDNRGRFYRDRPGETPSFADVCPTCQSINVDVIDPIAEALAARAPGGPGYGARPLAAV